MVVLLSYLTQQGPCLNCIASVLSERYLLQWHEAVQSNNSLYLKKFEIHWCKLVRWFINHYPKFLEIFSLEIFFTVYIAIYFVLLNCKLSLIVEVVKSASFLGYFYSKISGELNCYRLSVIFNFKTYMMAIMYQKGLSESWTLFHWFGWSAIKCYQSMHPLMETMILTVPLNKLMFHTCSWWTIHS